MFVGEWQGPLPVAAEALGMLGRMAAAITFSISVINFHTSSMLIIDNLVEAGQVS